MNKLKRFKQNEQGSVTVEFSFMLVFLCVMLIFMFDLVLVRSTMGKLDTASYSLVNILRERTEFYKSNDTKREYVTQEDLTQLRSLAAKLLYGNSSSSNKFEIVVETLDKDKKVEKIGDTANCIPARPLDENKYLSPYSENSSNLSERRQIPVYQVTLCVDILSPFRMLLLNSEQRIENRIRSSSVAVAR